MLRKKRYFLSSGERKGKSPNLTPLRSFATVSVERLRCVVGGYKTMTDFSVTELQNKSLAESAGKRSPRG